MPLIKDCIKERGMYMRFHKLNGSQNTFGKALMLSHRRFLFHGMIFERALDETSVHVQCQKFEVRMHFAFYQNSEQTNALQIFYRLPKVSKVMCKIFWCHLHKLW